MLDAIERAGSLDSKKVVQALSEAENLKAIIDTGHYYELSK